MAGTMPGGNAIIEAVAAQNFRNPRREIPCRRRAAPKVSSFDIIYLLYADTLSIQVVTSGKLRL
jgi:hypothetical protein